MNHKIFILLVLIGLVTFSCVTSNNKNAAKKNCGYEMTIDEVNEISNWVQNNPNVYDLNNGSDVYSEINDSIRFNLPDTCVFELFLSKITGEEVVIDAYVPPNKNFINHVSCVFMNSGFSKNVPSERKIRIYSYSNPDGSGDSPFVIVLKLNDN